MSTAQHATDAALPEKLEVIEGFNGAKDIAVGGRSIAAMNATNQAAADFAAELVLRYNTHAALLAACEVVAQNSWGGYAWRKTLLAAIGNAQGGAR